MQHALFGSGAPGFDPALRCIQRRVLSGGAWIEHHPGWLDGHAQVFEQLREQTPWESHRRMMYEREVDVPRLVARAPREGPLAELLARLSATLTERYRRSLGGLSLSNISLAYYRDGNDSVAFHGDKVGRLAANTVVATVSVGAPRRFLMKPVSARPAIPSRPSLSLRPKAGPAGQDGGSSGPIEGSKSLVEGASLAFDLGWGDLFVMGGSCQRTWLHAVPKRAHADPRISIMFRPPIPES